MKEGKIDVLYTLGGNIGKREIDALVLGHFAIHPLLGVNAVPHDEREQLRTMTHVPTGLMVAIFDRVEDATAALQLAGRLDAPNAREARLVHKELLMIVVTNRGSMTGPTRATKKPKGGRHGKRS